MMLYCGVYKFCVYHVVVVVAVDVAVVVVVYKASRV
jgi:hypothetical protein